MKVSVLGNCQIAGIAKCMRVMNPHLEVETLDLASVGRDVDRVRDRMRANDVIFLLTLARKRYPELFSEVSDRILLFPRIFFPAYHPDIAYLYSSGNLVGTPIGDYNSKLTLAGFLKGLTPRETAKLFNRDVFRNVGYLDTWDFSLANLRREARETKLNLDDAPLKWSKSGCFMHSINHPKLHVLADLARTMLMAGGLEVRTSNPENYVQDDLKRGPIWPVYPEIAAGFGIEGDYCFKTTANDPDPKILDLSEFVERSFAVYANLPLNSLETDHLDMKGFCDAVFGQARPKPVNKSAPKAIYDNATAQPSHPYASVRISKTLSVLENGRCVGSDPRSRSGGCAAFPNKSGR
jgi:hypothetical protein